MTIKQLFSSTLIAGLLCLGGTATANKAPPLLPAKKATLIEISVNVDYAKRATNAEVKLPRALLPQLLGASKHAPRKALFTPERRTVVAGTAMAMGFAFLGLWFFRNGRRKVPFGPLLIVIGLGTTLLFAGLASGKKAQPLSVVKVKGLTIKVDRGKSVRLDLDGDKVCEGIDSE